MIKVLAFTTLLSVALCDVSHILVTTTTPPPPPKPYAFGYAAGRYPGNIDRTHSEVSDGFGTIQGSYSYVDPSHKIRTVSYVADKEGFHPILNYSPPPLPQDSEAVALAKEKHLRQYESIANKHQAGILALPRESAAVARAREDHLNRYNAIAEAQKVVPGVVVVPVESAAVHRATVNHYNLFQKIAEDHARIAAEREAQRLADEATAEPNYLEEHH